MEELTVDCGRRGPACALLLALALILVACAAPAGPAGAPTPEAPTTVPTITPPAASPTDAPTETPAPAGLPPVAPARADLADVVGGYLAAGGEVAGLVEALRGWGALSDDVGGVWEDVDLDGDGRGDLVITLLDTAAIEGGAMPLQPPGMLLAYVRRGGGAEPVHRAASEAGESIPTILWGGDLDGDGRDEILYTTRVCGAHTCFVELHGYRWEDAEGALVTLLGEPIVEPYAEYAVQDVDGDGVQEIVVDVGTIGSVGAGPQRTYRRTYGWDGAIYALRDERPTSPAHPIHVIHDADDLMAAGRYAEAAAEFERSYTDPTLDRSWGGPAGWEVALEAYARYRVVVAQAALGDVDAARAAYGALSDRIEPGEWTDVWLGSAEAFWEAYEETGSAADGCGAVASYVLPEDLAGPIVLNEFGYANRTYTPEDLCLLGPGG